ncbi:MAG: hypothetical protein ABIK09_07665 [Pseudomonadota bacterium]
MTRCWILFSALILASSGCAGLPDEPEAVVTAALDAARDGDLDGFLQTYTSAAARDLKRAIAAAEGSGWVPEAPLRLLTPGGVTEVHRDEDIAVVEIRNREETTPVCLTPTDRGWRLTTDEAVRDRDGWSCRPHLLAHARLGEDHAAEE